MSYPVAFIACCERGRLEQETLLLVRSLRRFGGALASAPIFTFQPRPGTVIAPATERALRALDVVHLSVVLNDQHAGYPLANKPAVCAFAEQHVDADTLVFVDSDKVFFGEPRALLDGGVAVRPVDHRTAGTTGSDENAAWWRDTWQRFGAAPRGTVQATVSGETVQAYWNSGLVAWPREAGMARQWQRCLATLMDENRMPENRFFGEQICLALALDLLGIAPRVLPPAYNYPIHHHHALAARDGAPRKLEDTVSIHYHKLFARPSAEHPLDALRDFDTGTPAGRWLREELARTGLYAPSWLARLKARLRA